MVVEAMVRSGVAIQHSLIGVVDDDESVRESLPDLLGEFGFRSRVFSSAEEFLAADALDEVKCLLLDIGLPGMSGLDLQEELRSCGRSIPIVFITARKDESVRKRAIEQGAADILCKPFSDLALQEALSKAMRGS